MKIERCAHCMRYLRCYEKNGLDEIVLKHFNYSLPSADLHQWEELSEVFSSIQEEVTIALIGKYVKLHDAYLSVVEALHHAGLKNKVHIQIRWIDSEELTEESVAEKLSGCHGILIPGGFGNRGIEGKIVAANYARIHNIPYLGICLGMQIAAIAFARSVLQLKDANSAEFDNDCQYPIIHYMQETKRTAFKRWNNAFRGVS